VWLTYRSRQVVKQWGNIENNYYRPGSIGLLSFNQDVILNKIEFQPAVRWVKPLWSLAALLAALATLGPFAIDTYLPAFDGISESLGATPFQMQQTLSAYLLGFSAMLLHGALSDSFGRRPVILGGLAVFALASMICAVANRVFLFSTINIIIT